MSKDIRQAKLQREIGALGGAMLLGIAVLLYAVRVSDQKRDAKIAASVAADLERQQARKQELKWKQFEKDAPALTPANAADCGTSNKLASGESGRVSDCIAAALKARKPFQANFEAREMNQTFQEKLIGTAEGSIYFLSRYGGVYGSSYILSFCKHPTVIKTKGKQRLLWPRWERIK